MNMNKNNNYIESASCSENSIFFNKETAGNDTEDGITSCEDSFKSHQTLCDITEKSLKHILTSDLYLNDIPCDVTLDEVLAQIAVVKGQSITIYVRRSGFSKFKIVVPESKTTVLDLKQAIKRHYELVQRRLANRINKFNDRNSRSCANSGSDSDAAATSNRSHNKINRKSQNSDSEYFGKTKISWRYIWRTYLLVGNDGQRLTDDNKLLSHYGVVNKSVLTFITKRRKEKQHQHVRKKKK